MSHHHKPHINPRMTEHIVHALHDEWAALLSIWRFQWPLVLLSLLDDSARIPIQGHVAWVNPPHAAGNRPQGFGIQLPDNETCRELRKKVEGLLAGALQSSRPTHTL